MASWSSTAPATGSSSRSTGARSRRPPSSRTASSTRRPGNPIPFAEGQTSGLGVGVPGTLRTWQEALRRFGTRSLRLTHAARDPRGRRGLRRRPDLSRPDRGEPRPLRRLHDDARGLPDARRRSSRRRRLGRAATRSWPQTYRRDRLATASAPSTPARSRTPSSRPSRARRSCPGRRGTSGRG